jgi:peptide/nickel transport system ATP-binding protein
MMEEPILAFHDLSISFDTKHGPVAALRKVSLDVRRGETLGIVGESGSGKTTGVMAAIGLLPDNAKVANGRILLQGKDITHASEATLRSVRGTSMAMVFQNSRAALNPIRRIGDQIVDAIRAHKKVSRKQASAQALDLLKAVRFREPERRIHAYPHELSGGMCQRAMIAIAIACEPQLLIADEPTTGLDATTQKAVMDVLAELTASRGMSLILITHDLGLAAEYCDRIAVMQRGEVVETAAPRQLFLQPVDDYTRKLIAATPLSGGSIEQLASIDGRAALPAKPEGRFPPGTAPILDVRNLTKVYDGMTVVNSVSFVMQRGQSLGLVGESGSGKSTTSRLLSRLIDQTSGEILFDGQDIGGIEARDFYKSPLRREIQIVFQDPTDSLNPRFTAFQSIADPLKRLTSLRRRALRERVEQLADQVEFPRDLLDRLPHHLSGGQKARVGIARALAVEPRLLILDEPTAALDVSVQAIILTLLERLKREIGLSYLFVSHDLNVVKMMCDQTIVLRAGAIVENAPTEEIFANPQQPYTRELLAAVAHFDFDLLAEAGDAQSNASAGQRPAIHRQ